MYDELSRYLSRYIEVTDDLLEAIKKSSIIKKYERGSHIIREGDANEDTIFVLKGCLRKYKLKDGEDYTIEIYTDEQAVIPTISNTGESPYSIECVMDSLVLKSNESLEKRVTEQFPALKDLCLTLSETLAEKIQNDLSLFKTMTPEERYQHLLENKPELLDLVPQYQIASYLGIKPESLSRIKKRIALNLSQ